ncbi:hypothetical protein F8M41_016170 [Gigaspora margarita]|uniref:Uncharacterized protein n=1 Tax=Gigaspora margarita TaxID=4874 RepID=A0A8H3WVG8_GIGMA|nr:hypothetical protein F8M41_016170 [Gigaspora margarita]
MEYPPTSEDGIAIVYNIEAWNNNSEAFMSNIQYKLGRPCGGGDNSTYCPFLESSVKKSYYTCQGVKICENLNLEIKNRSHCEVDMDVDLLQSTNKSLDTQ